MRGHKKLSFFLCSIFSLPIYLIYLSISDKKMFRRLLLFFVVLPVVIINGATETYIRFDLIRDQHSYASHPVQLARNDVIRQAVISRRLSRIRTPMNSSFDMLINSGAFSGTGQYFALVQVGTPARPFVLVIDTGSDLTWIKCKNTTSPETEPVGHRFDARKSRTFRPITCSSPLCKMDLPFSLTECTEPTNPCLYDYVYVFQVSSIIGFKFQPNSIYYIDLHSTS